jgi:hypothetical protein
MPRDLGFWVGSLGVMFVIMLPFVFRPIGDIVTARPRTVFWIGVGMILAGLVAVPLIIFTWPGFTPAHSDGFEPAILGIVYFSIIGAALTQMPRSTAALRRFQRAATTNKSEPQISKERAFRGTREAGLANLATVRDIGPFLRLIGPWVVVLWAAPFVGLRIATHEQIVLGVLGADHHSMNRASQLLSERFPFSAAAILAYPFALVTWHRHIIARKAPEAVRGSLVVATLRYLWRLYMMLIVFAVLLGVAASGASDIAHFFNLKSSAAIALALLSLLLLVELFYFSSWSLVFPAVAVGNRDFLGLDSLRLTRPLGNAFRAGLVLSLVPFGLLWGLSLLALTRVGLTGAEMSLADYAPYLAPIAFQFLALASCATYLSRIYVDREVAQSGSAVSSLQR